MTKIHEQMTGPDKWCKCCLGRDNRGKRIDNVDELHRAVRCCAVGWIHKVYGDKADQIMEKVQERINEYWITIWNDSATFKEVYSVFKELDL
jgi:hypothetical protein